MSEKVEEYKRKLEQHKAKRQKQAKLFSPEDILADSSKIQRAYIAEIDRTVEYGPLTLADMNDIMKAETDQERAIVMLWKMLEKANPKWTLEKVRQLPLDVATAILAKISGPLTSKILKSGSKRTPQLSYTD